MSRPTFDSLRIRPHVGKELLLFKESQAMMPEGGMQPDVGQSPVTGNPDEMQAPESANQRQFEDDFGSLAYQFVQDRAPALIPYLLGFEVVDRNEDGSKAVGIFGYKVDDDFYYIPVFFLNNQVRGVDMILNKKTNQFVPLTEKWIDFIINKHSIRIGSPADSEVRDTMRNPDLSFVQRPQTDMGKIASDSEPWSPSEAWTQIKIATAKLAEDPAFKEMFSGAISAAKGELQKEAESKYIKDFMEQTGGPEAMTRFLSTMHDEKFANAALSLYKGAESFWTEKLANASVHVDRMRKMAASRPKVRIVDSTEGLLKESQDTPASDIGEEDKAMSVEENARQIVEHDFTIEDARPEEDVAKVTEDEVLVDFEHRFQPPEGPGMYNFMMSDGAAREGILLNTVLSPSCDRNHTLVCFKDNGFVLAEACPRAMITTEFEEDADQDSSSKDVLKKLFDEAGSMSDIKIGDSNNDGKNYLFIDDKGNAAGPFCIKYVLVDGDNIRFATGYSSSPIIVTPNDDGLKEGYGFMDWDLSDRYHDEDGHRIKGGRCCCGEVPCDECSSSDFITVGTFSGMPKKTGAGVIIPHDWKALEIRKIEKYPDHIPDEKPEDRQKREAKMLEEYAKAKDKYTFSSASDILYKMQSNGIERIKVASDGTEFSVIVDGAKRRHGPMSYKSAAVDLVTRFGLRPRRAFSVLAKAASSGSAMMLVQIPSLTKKAQDGLVNVAMPAPLEQMPTIDPYSGVPVYTSPYVDITQGQYTGVPGLPPERGMTRGINVGGEMERNMASQEVPDEHNDSFNGALPIDEEARRLAEDAAKAGQRHVFDQAAIGGLAKVFDTANVVDSYIPDFMDTIDRLGRILFLFYWKHEDFNQRYGSDDVVQMEDSLRNVFKNMGELTLQLKEKSVQKD